MSAQQLGPYLLEAELGRGGMGVVWRAHDPALERTVAIKVVLAGLAGPEELARFRREALAQARLRHPAIVGLHTVGTTPTGQPYLVMDHVEGESLAQRLARDGPLPPAEAVRVVARLARAVQYAHARGVLHRDLKARNVLLDPAGEPVLIDFGLAALADRRSLTVTGEVMGTPGSMAPEQAVGDKARVGPRTDVYGLGAVLFEALTGHAPFEGRDVIGLLAAVLERPARAPSSLRPGLDPRLDGLVQRCLEKDPERRLPSAEALADALEGWGAGPRDRPRRRPLAAPALALAAGAALGVAAARGPWAAPPAPAGAEPPRTVDMPGDAARELGRRAEARATAGDLAAARLDLAAAARLAPSPAHLGSFVVARLLAAEPTPEELAELGRSAPTDELVRAAFALAAADAPSAGPVADAAVAAAADAPASAAARALAARGLVRGLADDPRAEADLEAARARDASEPLARALSGAAADVAPLDAAGDALGASLVLALSGRRALAAGDLAAACAALDGALERCPDSVHALEGRGAARLALAGREPGQRRAHLRAAAADAARLLELRGGGDVTLAVRLAAIRLALAFDPDAGLNPAELGAARLVLERGLERLPGQALLLCARAELRAATGDAAGAAADVAAVLEGTPDPVSAARAVALQVRLLVARGEVRQALALASGPREAAAGLLLAERALCRVTLRDPEGALEDALRARSLLPGHARAHLAVAQAHLAQGPQGLELSRSALDEALRLDPGLVGALVARALYGGRPAEARRDLDVAARLEPWSAEPHLARVVLLDAARDPAADAALDDALALEPASGKGRLMRGIRRFAAGDPRGASTDLALAAERTPWVPEALAYLAVVRQELGDLTGALDAAERCLELRAAPGDDRRALGRAWRVKAAVLLQREELDVALVAADAAVAADPLDADGLWIRGLVRGGRGDLRAALEDLDAALRLRPGAVQVRLDRAHVWILLGEKGQAVLELEALLPTLREPGHTRDARKLLEAARR